MSHQEKRWIIETGILVFLVVLHFVYFYFHGRTIIRGANVYGVHWALRYYLPKILPFTVFMVYLAAERLKFRMWLRNFFGWAGFSSSFATAPLLIAGFFVGVPVTLFMGDVFEWSYVALITWNLTFIAAYLLLYWRTRNSLLSLTFATCVISAGGMIYELPIYYRFLDQVLTHISFPCIVATKWVSFIFITYLLEKHKWKPTWIFWVALTAYTVHGLWYFGHWNRDAGYSPLAWLPVTRWLPRLVGAVLLLSLTLGFPISQLPTNPNAEVVKPPRNNNRSHNPT